MKRQLVIFESPEAIEEETCHSNSNQRCKSIW